MKRAAGSNFKNHSTFFSSYPQRNVNLSHQYVRNQGACVADWRKGHEIPYWRRMIKCTLTNYLSADVINMQGKPSHEIPTVLEYLLFQNATSKEEYLNWETLHQRMQQILSNVHGNFSISRVGGTTSSNSMSSYFPQPHATNYDMGLINQRVDSGKIQYNENMGQTGIELLMQSQTSNLMMPQLVSSETLEAFSDFPTLTSSLGPQDIVQYQPEKFVSQNNFTNFELPSVEPTLLQSGAWFVNHGKQCVGCKQKSLDQTQLATSLSNHVPFGNTTALSCTFKRRKMETGFGVPSIPSSSSDQHSYDSFQPYCYDPLSEALKFTASPSSEIKEYCNVEQFTNPMPDSMSIEDICEQAWGDILKQTLNTATFPSVEPGPKSYGKIDRSNLMGIDFVSNSGMHIKDPISIDDEEIEGRTGSNQAKTNATMKVFEQSANQESQTISSNSTVTEIETDATNDQLGMTYWNPIVLSEGLEVGQTSVELDPKIYGVTGSRNLMQMDFEFTSSGPSLQKDTISTYVDDIEGNTRFNHAGPSAIKNISEVKADKEKQKSEDARVREIQRSEIFESPQWYIFPSQGLEAGQISEEPVNKECSVTDNNLKDIHVSSNSSIIDVDELEGRIEFNELGTNVVEKLSEPDAFSQSFKSEMVPSKGSDAGQISKDPKCKNLMDIDIGSNSSMDQEDIQDRIELNHLEKKATEEVLEPHDDQEDQTKSSNATVNVVSLTELFTSDQIKEHIMSLRKESGQSAIEVEKEITDSACQLCAKQNLFFAQSPIYCLGCGNLIKRNSNYFYRKDEEFDARRCYCSECFKRPKGRFITFTNGTSIPKTLLEKKKNNEVIGERWVECSKCKRWQHQVCALYNNERDPDSSFYYICPVCCLEEIENGMRVPSPETAIFHAKDLPKTTLSDHLEERLFRRLIEEKKSYATENNLAEVLTAENISVREVVSVDKILNVEKQFLDILPEKDTYPAEFPYRSRVILLFQQIEGVDVCIFAMYVQEYGSECGYPNRRCVYVSYIDSVKHFRPQRGTIVKNEALRTFVYHEILIGYLDFVKKRGFGTCFIWACPPAKGEDYILYCHPTTQKTPKKDHLLQWYRSMLIKAAEENIVIGLTNVHDHLFVPTEKWDSKVTASQLPYFDGDYWSNQAVRLVTHIEKESGGDFEKPFNKLPKRSIKNLGHDGNPPKNYVKDILVMQKLGQAMLPNKEQFIVAHLQYSCMHCHEVIVSGKKRWFCTECNKIQECERCHTSDVHTIAKGMVHRLSEVTVDNVPLSTEKNNTNIYNGLLEDRIHFLDFCRKNHLQFDTLRHAKYASMMILYHLNNLHTQLCPSENNTLVERDQETLAHQ